MCGNATLPQIEKHKGRDGFYRCPFKCGNPDYPQRKWKKPESLAKHLAECPMNVPEWKPPPVAETPLREWATCFECGDILFEGETVYIVERHPYCWPKCSTERAAARSGYLDCAGMRIAGFDDVVA